MRTHALRRLGAAASLAGALLIGACGSFDVTNPNQPTLDDLVNNPTRGKLASAATGLLIGSRSDMTDIIWRLGSLGREGINLAGNNQPDYSEPYFGPLFGGGFGGDIWNEEYRQLRNANTYLDAVPKAAQLSGPNALSAAEASASLAFGKTLKGLALLYVIMAHGNLGAPVDVNQAVTATPAPFVSEDSVYGYILGQLNDAKADLVAAGSTAFPFPLPSGFNGFNTPATFLQFNRALAAKAYLYRATAANSSCGTQCYTDALTALSESFISNAPANFATGVYYDYSANAGDTENDLSDALDGATYFALPLVQTLSQKQPGPGGADDQRAIDKITPTTASSPQQVGGIPIVGDLKFTIYLTNGNANPSHPIPIIRNEELILLRAEAKLGQSDLGGAITDIDNVRTNAGKLAPYSGPVTPDAVLTELLYNRRYSLLWEQGATWVDARRFNRLNTIPIPPGFGNSTPAVSTVANSVVAPRFPIPDTECAARGLGNGCSPLGT
jgi:hypothetical protein